MPTRNDEYFFYQTVFGAWPPDLGLKDGVAIAEFAERVGAAMIKAVREAKERSSWSNPQAEYEAALGRFVAGALDGSKPNPFLADMAGFVERVARPGVINSLSQTLVKLTAPGVPDTYQGAELWDFSMVDPDNRRAVDWRRRCQLLCELKARIVGTEAERDAVTALKVQWRDGREKLFLIWRTLALRAERPQLFCGAEYVPLETSGTHGGRLLAFARKREGDWLVTVAPRLVLPLVNEAGIVDWNDTSVSLPEARWRDALASREIGARAGPVAAAELLADFPVALLVAA